MTKSPLKLFFSLGILFIIIGLTLYSLWPSYVFPQNNTADFGELEYARFLAQTGQFDAAIKEYDTIQANSISSVVKSQAALEHLQVIKLQSQRPSEIVKARFTYFVWYATPIVLILSMLFFTVWGLLLIFRLIIKRPELAILPILDLSSQNIGEKLPQIVHYRAKELTWKFHNLSSSKLILSEILDVPTIGLISDGDSFDVSAIIETALLFSGGPSNLPLSRMIDGINIWFQQPKHLIQCELNKTDDNIVLHMLLLKGSNKVVENSWSIQIKHDPRFDKPSQIADVIIFILLYRFGTKISARNWESLRALCAGLEKLQDYLESDASTKSLEDAKNSFEKAIEIDREYHLSIYNLGLVFLRMGYYDQARDQFKEVMLLSQDNKLSEYATYCYGATLLQLSQEWSYRRAIEVFSKLIEDTRNNDVNDMVRSALALAYAKVAERDKENQDTLLQMARQEIQTIKLSNRATQEVRAAALSAEGYCNLIVGNIQEAIQCFLESTKRDSNNISALIGLGNAYFKNSQKESAVKAYAMAENLSPSSGYPSYKLGSVYQDIGEIDQAILAYERSANFPLSSLALGKIYLQQEDHERALELFRKSVMHNKKLSDGWANIAWTICEMGTNDPAFIKEAEESARRALQVEQNQAQLWHRHCVLARVYLLSKKPLKALSEAKKAVELSPQSQAYYFLALVEKELGNKESIENIRMKILELGDSEWISKCKSLVSP